MHEASRRGFSLIELLVSLAIIGILASIAVPTLTWIVAKARQSEARSNLGTIADLEAVYHFENHAFGTLTDVGFTPDGENRYAYCSGDPSLAGACVQSATESFDFASGSGSLSSPPPLGGGGGGNISNLSGGLFCGSNPSTPCPTPTLTPAPTPHPGTTQPCAGNPHADVDEFEADAYGRISDTPPPHDLDCWLIDERKDLTNYRVGY